MNKRIREWLQQKSPTERRVAILLFFLCIATFYGCGLYLPLSRTVDALQARCDKLQQDLIWLDKQARIRGVLPQRSPSRPIANVIKKEAEHSGLTITLAQNQSGGLDVTADSINAGDFAEWLDRLQRVHRLGVEILEFHASPASAGNITLNKMTLKATTNDKR